MKQGIFFYIGFASPVLLKKYFYANLYPFYEILHKHIQKQQALQAVSSLKAAKESARLHVVSGGYTSQVAEDGRGGSRGFLVTLHVNLVLPFSSSWGINWFGNSPFKLDTLGVGEKKMSGKYKKEKKNRLAHMAKSKNLLEGDANTKYFQLIALKKPQWKT
ncbi:hypothetical protein ACJX0J_005566 [Zea mays]